MQIYKEKMISSSGDSRSRQVVCGLYQGGFAVCRALLWSPEDAFCAKKRLSISHARDIKTTQIVRLPAFAQQGLLPGRVGAKNCNRSGGAACLSVKNA